MQNWQFASALHKVNTVTCLAKQLGSKHNVKIGDSIKSPAISNSHHIDIKGYPVTLSVKDGISYVYIVPCSV